MSASVTTTVTNAPTSHELSKIKDESHSKDDSNSDNDVNIPDKKIEVSVDDIRKLLNEREVSVRKSLLANTKKNRKNSQQQHQEQTRRVANVLPADCFYSGVHQHMIVETGSEPPKITIVDGQIVCADNVERLCQCNVVAHSACIEKIISLRARSMGPLKITCSTCGCTYKHEVSLIRKQKLRVALKIAFYIFLMFILPCYVMKVWGFFPERRQLEYDMISDCKSQSAHGACSEIQITNIRAHCSQLTFWGVGATHFLYSFAVYLVCRTIYGTFRFISNRCGCCVPW